jgi:hypothetical protein
MTPAPPARGIASTKKDAKLKDSIEKNKMAPRAPQPKNVPASNASTATGKTYRATRSKSVQIPPPSSQFHIGAERSEVSPSVRSPTPLLQVDLVEELPDRPTPAEEDAVDRNPNDGNTRQPTIEETGHPPGFPLTWLNGLKPAHLDTRTVPPDSTESNSNENGTHSRQDKSGTALQPAMVASSDTPAAITAGIARAEPMSIDNNNAGLDINLGCETEDAEEVYENVDADLDRQADEMLNYIVELASRPNEWLDSLSPQDYLIKDDQYKPALEAGFWDADNLLRAAFHKIHDDPAKQYKAKLFDYETMKVKLKLPDNAPEIGVIEFWKPYSTLAVLHEKLSTMSFEAKAQAFSTLWKDIATKTQYLFYARQNRYFSHCPREWSFVVLFVITCAAQVDLEGALGELASYEDHFKTYNDQVANTLKLLRHHCNAYETMSTPEITAIWYHLHKKLRAVARKGMGILSTDRGGHEGSEQPQVEGQMASQAPDEPATSTHGEKRKAAAQHGEGRHGQRRKRKRRSRYWMRWREGNALKPFCYCRHVYLIDNMHGNVA